MENAYKFLIIFGVLLLLAAASLFFSKDPRNSVFFARMNGKYSRGKPEKQPGRSPAALQAWDWP